ncbi:MAG: peptide deformylase [Candidatus Omnitrophota bacterium]
MKYPILLYPDPRLRKCSEPVVRFDGPLKKFLQDLTDVMFRQPMGLGISAPQVGVLQRILIVDVGKKMPGASLRWILNPEILAAEEPVLGKEGCMSIPEYTAHVRRPRKIRLRWQDENGRFCESEFFDIEARCMQHEIDHLDGILFIDKVVSLKSDLIPRRK